MTEERDYKEEYREYHGKPSQIKRRASRNAARRKMVKAKRANKRDGKDVDHKDGNPMNNSSSNLRVVDKETNRAKKALVEAMSLLPVAKALTQHRVLLGDVALANPPEPDPIQELKALVEQAGARHNMSDNEMIQRAHDLLVELGAMCGGAPGVEAKGALILRHPGHGSQKVHGHKGTGGSSSAVEDAKKKLTDRAGKLGYSNMSFEETKDGGLRLAASGPRGGKATKQNVYITPGGRIVAKRGGKITSEMTDGGWKVVNE